MKTLLFLTDRFPFGKGEAFIENEIEYIADAFDKVYILPVGLTVNVKEQRSLPVNVKVLPLRGCFSSITLEAAGVLK